MNLLATLFCGAAAGWIAGKVMHSSHGLIMNIILGLIGSSIGSWILAHVGISEMA